MNMHIRFGIFKKGKILQKKFFSKLLFFFLSISLLFSCSFNKKPSGAKVYVVALGLCYPLMSGNYLSAPVSDVVEFTEFYKSCLDTKGIDYEIYYMLDYGTSISLESDVTSPYYPTTTNLISVLQEINTKCTKNDLLVFLYSGHGKESENREWSAKDNGALCLRHVEQEENRYTLYSQDIEYFYLDDLVSILKDMPLTKAMILDSCFSGSLVGSIIDSEGAGESLGSNGSDYTGQNTVYKIAFDSLQNVSSFGVVTASRANEVSLEIGPLFGSSSESLFGAENHGFLFGNLLVGLGYTHTQDEQFSTVKRSTVKNTKVHSSFRKDYEVNGKLPSIEFMESLEFSTGDLFKIARKANNEYSKYGASQLTMEHFGPVDIRLLW